MGLLMLPQRVVGQAGSNDLTFNPSDVGFGAGDGCSSSVNSSALQADGKIILGGGFAIYNGVTVNRIARLNADGTLDPGFITGTGANNTVQSIAIQLDGKILIGGFFTTFNGTTKNRITRLNANGSVDAGFDVGTGVNAYVAAFALQSDGKIIIGGDFITYNGIPRNRIARLNQDGTLDTTFDPGAGANTAVRDIKIQSDGKILVVGQFTTYNGVSRNRVVRLNTDGSIDTTFDSVIGADNDVYSLILQPDGKIVIGGFFTNYNGVARTRLARLHPDGSIDGSFVPTVGGGVNSYVLTMQLQPDGKIFIAGDFTTYAGISRNKAARINSDSSLDAGFTVGTGANFPINTSLLQSDGKVIFGGSFSGFNSTSRNFLVRLLLDGNDDLTFNLPITGANNQIYTTTIQHDGKILIGGFFNGYDGVARYRLARLNSNGSLDNSFIIGTGANSDVNAFSVQNDNKVIVVGEFTTYNGTVRNRIVRLNSNGSLDATFNPGTGSNGLINTVAIQPDGKILIGGLFTSYNGSSRNNIARINADGTLDTSFDPGTGALNQIRSIVIQNDGKIIIAGSFTTFNGINRNRIARLNADGSIDSGFNPGTGVNNSITAVCLQSDGKIIIGGFFTNYNGISRNFIARINPDASLDASFIVSPSPSSNVDAIAVQGDGKIIVGGAFTVIGGIPRVRLCRLNSNGTVDISFNPGTGLNAGVRTIAFQQDGKIIVVGSFTAYNGIGRNRIARIWTDVDTDADGTGNWADCQPNNPAIFPGAPETCNGADDNCNGIVDDGFTSVIAGNTISSSEGNTICAGESTTLTLSGGTLGIGAVWTWYEGGCGTGAPIGTGPSITVSPSAGIHEYFVRAVGLCNVTVCKSIQIIANAPPTFTLCPSVVEANNATATCSATVNYSVTASGSPAPSLVYVFTGVTTGSGSGTGSGSIFNEGTTTVTITAQNECGTAQCTFEVTVHDAEAPEITGCPDPIVADVEPGQWGAHVTWAEPTASDNCAMGSLTSPFAPGDFFNVGTTTVTYTALDMAGNAATCSFTVTVQQPDILGDVNVSIFADDILFTNSNPDPGSFITVSATVNNTSNVTALDFVCRLENQYSNEVYPDVTIAELEANESIIISWTIQTPPDPAFVPMKISIDLTEDLDESNELDNQAIRPFINGDFDTEGLIEVIVNTIPTATAGSVISICGNAYYDDTAVELLDPDVSGAQVTIHIEETGQILYGVTDANGDYCVSYFTSNTPGTYHFTVEVTDFTITGDTSGTFQLSTPVCSKDLSLSVELFGDFLCNSRYHIVQGSSLTGIVYVRNGCQAVSTSTTLFIALPDGTPVPGPFVIPALAPGENYEVTLPAMTFNTVGTTFIHATIDFYNVVAENNESNNSASRTITVHPPSPDISPATSWVSSPYQCTQDAVSFRIDNKGGVPTGAFNTLLEVYHGNTLEATFTQPVSSITPLCSANITFGFSPASSGQYFFHLYCDTLPQVVSEISELNNSLSFSQFFQECGNDLVVHGCGSLDVKPTDLVSPGNITLFASIGNEGKLPVATPFVVNFDVAGTIYPVTVNQTIPVQGTKQVMVTVPAPSYGNNDLLITVDANNDVAEMKEYNNSAADKLCWDFSLSNLTCDGEKEIASSHYICNPITLKTRVINQGLYEASHLGIRFEVSGPGLPPGWTNLGLVNTFVDRTCGCPLRVTLPNTFLFPQAGTYMIRMRADVNSQYVECNEGNNELVLTVQVVENADYAIYAEFIAPSELNPGVNEPITIDVTYKNEGCSGLTPVELFVQTDNEPFDSVQANPLAANAFNTYSMPDTWSSALPGLHIISATIDHDGALTESNELNNVATRSVIVGGAPNVDLFELTASNMSPLAGETIILTASMTNEGEISAEGVLQFFYVNDQQEEVLIEQQPVFITSNETLSVDVSWFVTQPGAQIIARVSQVVPVEFDFTDNEKELQLNNLSVSIASTDVACNGLALGILEATIAGGKSPFTLLWSNGYTVDSITVPAGIYSLQVTDDNGLTAFAMDTVSALAIPEEWYLDEDQDGFGNVEVSQLSCMHPAGYVMNHADCNDADPYVNPLATELCDGIDNECDGMTDDEDDEVIGQSSWYLDADGDGFGDPDVSVIACFQPANYIGTGTDCDDTDAGNNPAATEVFDGEDNDCDGLADEGLSAMSANAGDCKVVYNGYAPAECTVLTVNVQGGVAPYTYAWSSGANTVSTIVCPEVTTIYNVVVTDQNGNTTQDAVTVQVVDVSCGNNKVSVCHVPPGNPSNTQTICISVNAVASHLEQHADYLGTCGAQDPCAGENQSLVTPTVDKDHQHKGDEHIIKTNSADISGKEIQAAGNPSGSKELQVYPNPTNGMVFVQLPGTHGDAGVLRVITSQGQQLQSRQVSGGQQLVLDLSSHPKGMYLVVVNFNSGQWQQLLGIIE